MLHFTVNMMWNLNFIQNDYARGGNGIAAFISNNHLAIINRIILQIFNETFIFVLKTKLIKRIHFCFEIVKPCGVDKSCMVEIF